MSHIRNSFTGPSLSLPVVGQGDRPVTRQYQVVDSQYAGSPGRYVDFNLPGKPYDLLELEITYRCNYFCPNCNRMIGRFTPADAELTLDQLDLFIDQARRAHRARGQRFRWIAIMGGEPLMHRHFLTIWERLNTTLVEEKIVEQLQLVTNGEKEYPPEIHRWPHMTLKVPISRKYHSNFYISPADWGLPMKPCPIPTGCGIALTPWGYMPCGPGGSLIRLFGQLDMILQDLPPHLGVWDYNRICGHCAHAAAVPSAVKKVDQDRSKIIECSHSFAAAFEQWEDVAKRLPRYGAASN